MNETRDAKQLDIEAEREVTEIARDKANLAKWGLNSVIFLFMLLIIIIILVSQGLGMSFVASVAIVGLGTVWVTGWRRGRRFFKHFYHAEISNQIQNSGTEATTSTLQLTRREIQVLEYVANGYSNKQLASEMGIGVSTAKAFLGRIFTKLNASDRTHAVVLAIKRGLISI